ncbi:hypothetical protein [uncultured Photobacterium sp.]|uniref:hypothetical protein n=1 Tax=uncultured Photobacterium sp. TaxID=173973 RepID=UPI00261AD70C|nr:hypothetical protein [uncultured Photobacterium sp.]
MITGETEAKAILKGTLRQAQAVGDELLCLKMSRANIYEKKSRASAERFMQEELAWYGDFILFNKRYRRLSSWHFCAEFSAIEPELAPAEGMGNLCGFILGYYDSRKHLKGKPGFYLMWASNFYFHEHFLVRGIQRFNEKSIGEIGAIVYPVIEWLISENVPITRLNDVNYFVFRNFILVSNKLPKSNGLVFKTILLTNVMTKEQEMKFSNALATLENGKIEAVMTNEHGDVVRKIPPATGKSLIVSLSDKSFWVQNVLTKRDYRFNNEPLIDQLENMKKDINA